MYQKAADLGNTKAQPAIGFMYSKGEGVTQNSAEALKWFLKAAENGNAKAQIGIGVRYYTGKGVTQDYKEALIWYKKSAEQGNEDAKEISAMTKINTD